MLLEDVITYYMPLMNNLNKYGIPEEYEKFDRVEKRFNVGFPIGPQLYAFLVIGELRPFEPIVKENIRDPLYPYDLGCLKRLAPKLTPEIILELFRCGIYFDLSLNRIKLEMTTGEY